MWNADGNFDRHDAFVMLMLIREDKLIMNGDSNFKSRHEERDSDYLGEDKFFTNNYNKNDKKEKWEKQLERLGKKSS